MNNHGHARAFGFCVGAKGLSSRRLGIIVDLMEFQSYPVPYVRHGRAAKGAQLVRMRLQGTCLRSVDRKFNTLSTGDNGR